MRPTPTSSTRAAVLVELRLTMYCGSRKHLYIIVEQVIKRDQIVWVKKSMFVKVNSLFVKYSFSSLFELLR